MKKDFKIKKLEKGDTFYTFDGYKNHIIDFVYDEENDEKLVVYKCWLKYKGYWGYYCKELKFILHEIYLVCDMTEEQKTELYKINEVEEL